MKHACNRSMTTPLSMPTTCQCATLLSNHTPYRTHVTQTIAPHYTPLPQET